MKFLLTLLTALLFSVPSLAALPATCTSSNSSVSTASATAVAAAQNYASLTLMNTHASQTIYVSFTTPATTSDLKLAPLAALSFTQFGPKNALYVLGSGASTTYAIIGCKQ